MEEEETDVHQLGERIHFQFNFHFLVDCSQTASIYWTERNRQKSIILILEWFKSFPAHSPASLPSRFHWLDTITYCITTHPWPIIRPSASRGIKSPSLPEYHSPSNNNNLSNRHHQISFLLHRVSHLKIINAQEKCCRNVCCYFTL